MDPTHVGQTNDDYNLQSDRMAEVADETHQNIDRHHTQLFEGVTNLIETLCTVVKEARVAVSRMPTQSQEVGPSNDRLAKVKMYRYHRKVQALSKALKLGTLELNNMIQDITYVEVDMFVLPMFILYNIQQVVVDEIKVREHTVQS